MATVRLNGFVEPCIPTRAAKPPAGPGWVHDFKHDGYRLIVRRDGDTVRLVYPTRLRLQPHYENHGRADEHNGDGYCRRKSTESETRD
jgi:hypothetical protein